MDKSTIMKKPSNVFIRQKKLAEATNATILSQLIHNSIRENELEAEPEPEVSFRQSYGSNFGNKMSTLAGDYLLADVFRTLAEIRNPTAFEYMSIGLASMIEGQMVPDIIAKQDPLEYWEHRNYLLHSSLIANGCRSAVLLAGMDSWQLQAYEFGHKFALAWRLAKEMRPFTTVIHNEPKVLDLNTLPVLLGHQDLSEWHRLRNANDYDKLYQIIVDGSSLNQCADIKRKYTDAALDQLSSFPENMAKVGLLELLRSL